MEQTILFDGARLKRLRNEMGLSAAVLARRLGITENAIRKLEAGDSKEPRFSVGMRLADELGTSPEGLVQRRAALGDRARPPELASVIQRIRRLRPMLARRGVTHVSVFGSVARGEAGPDSDVDIMVDGPLSLLDLAKIVETLKEELGRKADVQTVGAIKGSGFAAKTLGESVAVY